MIARITQWMERLFDLAISRSAPGTERDRRSRGVLQGTISALGGRGVSLLVTIVSIPLAVRYLGSERYGAWVTISSFLAFLSFTDLGLVPSLTNALGKAEAEETGDVSRRYVSSALLVLSLIAILILVFGNAFAPRIATFLFPNLQSSVVRNEIVPAVMISLSIFALNFPLLITQRVLAAKQEIAIANLWNMAGGIANLTAILGVIWLRAGLPWLVLGCFGLGLLLNAASAVWLFGFREPSLRPSLADIDLDCVKILFSDGWKFFVISAAWVINSQTDNLVIAHFLGAGQVTPYSIAFRLFAMATLLQALAYPSLWPAYTNAYAQKDFAWIRGIYSKNLKVSFFTTASIVIVLTIFGEKIIQVWAGPAAVPPFSVILWMAVWNVILATLYVPGCLLNATGHLKGMTIYGTVTAVLNLFLSILLVRIYGIAGVIAGTVLAYTIGSYVPTLLEARAVLRRLALESAPTQIP